MTTQAQNTSGRTAWLIPSVAILALIFVVACGQKETSPQSTASAPPVAAQPPPPTAQPAQPDPVALLKAHLDRLQKSCAEHEVIRFHDNTSQPVDRRREQLGDLRYDVQRTSSLVSPIVGRVSFKMINQGMTLPSYFQYDMTLGFQDGVWVLTDMKSRYNLEGRWASADPGLDEEVRQQAAEEFRKRMGVR
jgi:hypothetical protein